MFCRQKIEKIGKMTQILYYYFPKSYRKYEYNKAAVFDLQPPFLIEHAHYQFSFSLY